MKPAHSRPRRRCAPPGQHGFTLLEILWALLVASIVAGSLAGSLNLAYKAKKKAEARALDARTAHAALDMLARDLEGALPPNGVLVGPFLGQDPAAPSTTGELVELYACRSGTAQWGPNADGIQRITYGIGSVRDEVTGVTEQALLRSVTRNLLAPAVEVRPPEVVCRGLRELTIQYFDGLLWQAMWDSTTLENRLPMAVQITLRVSTRTPAGELDPLAVTAEPYRATRVVSLPCAAPATAAGEAAGDTGGTQ